MVDEQNVCREVKYRQIAVTHRLVDVNESRFIRSCSFVSACLPQSVFISFPFLILLFPFFIPYPSFFSFFSSHQSINFRAMLSLRGISGRFSLEKNAAALSSSSCSFISPLS